MSVELIKKSITLDEMTKKESVQVVKERDLIVPDGKPDMQKVVEIEGNIKMDPIDVTTDRVMYRGNIELCILYRSAENPRCLYSMKGSIPVEDFVILEGIDKDQRVDFDYDIEHISYNILNERKLNVKAILKVDVEATGCKDVTIITKVDTEELVETKKDALEIVSLGNEKEDKVIISEELTIPQNKPCIGEILKTSVVIRDEQIKRMENEIKYSGMIELVTMYKVADEDEKIEMASNKMMFEGSIEDIQRDEEAYWDCTLSVEPMSIEVAPDYDGEDRILDCECMVTASYKTYNKDSYDTVSDIYFPGKKIDTKEMNIGYMNLEDKVSLSMPKKEAIEIGEYEDSSIEVFDVKVKPIVEEKVVTDGKVVIKGLLEMTAICLVVGEDSYDIENIVNMVPFAQELDIKKGVDKPYVSPTIRAKNANVYAQTKKELVIEYMLDCIVDIYTNQNIQLLEDLEAVDMTKEELDSYPSMTVYQVGKGDTLWGLAKKFNTTVNDILDINDMESGDVLKEGQKIIILKKVKF